MNPIRHHLAVATGCALALVLALLLAFGRSGTVASMTQSQATTGTPETLGAVECDATPVDPDAYARAIVAATPIARATAPLSGGTPADAATTAAATDTIRQTIACTNAGDYSRLLAVTDPGYAFTILDLQPDDAASVVQDVASTPGPINLATPHAHIEGPASNQIQLVSVDQVMVLSDGEIWASVTIASPATGLTTVQIDMRFEGGRYVLVKPCLHRTATLKLTGAVRLNGIGGEHAGTTAARSPAG